MKSGCCRTQGCWAVDMGTTGCRVHGDYCGRSVVVQRTGSQWVDMSMGPEGSTFEPHHSLVFLLVYSVST